MAGPVVDPFNKVADALKGKSAMLKDGASNKGAAVGKAESRFRITMIESGEFKGEFKTRLYKEGGKSNEFVDVYARQVQMPDGKFKLKPVALEARVWNGKAYEPMRLPIPDGFERTADIVTIVERPDQSWFSTMTKGRKETKKYECDCAVLTEKEHKTLEAIEGNPLYKAGARLAAGKRAGVTASGYPSVTEDKGYALPLRRGEESLVVHLDDKGKVVAVEFEMKGDKGVRVPVENGPNILQPGVNDPAALLEGAIKKAEERKSLNKAKSAADGVKGDLKGLGEAAPASEIFAAGTARSSTPQRG